MIQKIKIAASRFLSNENIHAPVDAFIMSYEKSVCLKAPCNPERRVFCRNKL